MWKNYQKKIQFRYFKIEALLFEMSPEWLLYDIFFKSYNKNLNLN